MEGCLSSFHGDVLRTSSLPGTVKDVVDFSLFSWKYGIPSPQSTSQDDAQITQDQTPYSITRLT